MEYIPKCSTKAMLQSPHETVRYTLQAYYGLTIMIVKDSLEIKEVSRDKVHE